MDFGNDARRQPDRGNAYKPTPRSHVLKVQAPACLLDHRDRLDRIPAHPDGHLSQHYLGDAGAYQRRAIGYGLAIQADAPGGRP